MTVRRSRLRAISTRNLTLRPAGFWPDESRRGQSIARGVRRSTILRSRYGLNLVGLAKVLGATGLTLEAGFCGDRFGAELPKPYEW